MSRIGTRTGADCVDVLLAGEPNGVAPATVSDLSAPPKFFWLELRGTPGATWRVEVARAGVYRARAVIRAPGRRVSLVRDGVELVAAVSGEPEWDLLELGDVYLDCGGHEIEIRVEAGAIPAAVRSLELTHGDELAALDARVARYQAAAAKTRSRLQDSTYGLMVQYGAWSHPRRGHERLSLDEHTDAFDVERFADQAVALGVGHVIWSLTWWTFTLATPSAAVDRIVGGSGLTARRDLIGELAQALHARDILFFLYAHSGHDSHLGYGSTTWWQAQRWPSEFTTTGSGDRSTACASVAAILTELGGRYGTLLDGWFLDDGMMYYPTGFERLAGIARIGNPGRLLAINSWILPSMTPFQDIDFGEGRRSFDDVMTNADGTITSGRLTGLLAHAMTPLQPEWGVHEPEQYQQLDDWANAGLDELIVQARGRRLPVTLDLLMWNNGELDPLAEQRLAALPRLHHLNRD